MSTRRTAQRKPKQRWVHVVYMLPDGWLALLDCGHEYFSKRPLSQGRRVRCTECPQYSYRSFGDPAA